MERYMIFIPATGKCSLIQCDDECPATLETLQELVDGIDLIVNEEGLLRQLPDNPRATDLYAYGDRSTIVGDALLAAGRGEDLIGFTKPVCKTLAEFWSLDMEDGTWND